MSTLEKLLEITEVFFSRHWSESKPHPQWRFDWQWRGPVPNYLLGGVYCLVADDNVVYVGLGNSRGGGIYKERGLSRRLEAHVLDLAPKGCSVDYLPKERWQTVGVSSIGTIGFPAELSYLAPALEDYLIGELNPPENSVRRRNA